jgi:trk system potassium uptake protein TrkH
MWPSFSKALILLLMVTGACAGSTGGGYKIARVLLAFKSLGRNIRQVLNPRKVRVIRINNKIVDEQVLDNANAYLAAYVIIIILVFIVISLDGFSVEANLSATLSCFNNIGPGLAEVGPTCNFSGYSDVSTFILTIAMLTGRLEIFPILVLFTRSTWKRK